MTSKYPVILLVKNQQMAIWWQSNLGKVIFELAPRFLQQKYIDSLLVVIEAFHMEEYTANKNIKN